jgi:mono/diheme cytochrome c family protein
LHTERGKLLSACGLARLAVVLASVAVLAGCRQDMHDQAKLEPLEAAAFFADGAAARPLPPNTVARGQLREDRPFYTGFVADRVWVEELPVELTPELLARGRERFTVYCTPCHDRTGSGRGMIVQRGFKQPPSYHQERLRQVPIGYFFDVISNGFGAMSSYAAQVKPADRWAIAAWVRVLQRSQHAPVQTLPESDVEQLERMAAATADAAQSAEAAGGEAR